MPHESRLAALLPIDSPNKSNQQNIFYIHIFSINRPQHFLPFPSGALGITLNSSPPPQFISFGHRCGSFGAFRVRRPTVAPQIPSDLPYPITSFSMCCKKGRGSVESGRVPRDAAIAVWLRNAAATLSIVI